MSSTSDNTTAEPSAQAAEGLRVLVLAAPTAAEAGFGYEVRAVGHTSAVLAYTSRPKLVECCGGYQPWAEVDFAALVDDVAAQHLAGPIVDAPIAPAMRWTSAGPPPRPDGAGGG